MKRIALLMIMGFLALGINAQDCAKKCASKASTTSVEKSTDEGTAEVAAVAQIVDTDTASEKAVPACCAAKKAEASVETKVASVKMVAEEAAEMDEAIEKKVSAETGNVSFVRNYICPETNKEVSVEVTFDEETQKFVDIKEAKSPNCGPDCKKACCAAGECKDKTKACCAGKKTE